MVRSAQGRGQHAGAGAPYPLVVRPVLPPDAVNLCPEIKQAALVPQQVNVGLRVVPTVRPRKVLPRADVKVRPGVVRLPLRLVERRRVETPAVLREHHAVGSCGGRHGGAALNQRCPLTAAVPVPRRGDGVESGVEPGGLSVADKLLGEHRLLLGEPVPPDREKVMRRTVLPSNPRIVSFQRVPNLIDGGGALGS